MRFSKIKYGKVVSVIVADSEYILSLKGEYVECDDTVTIGYLYDGVNFLTSTLGDLKTKKIDELNTWHDIQTEKMSVNYSRTQKKTFEQKKVPEAIAYTNDNTAPTPYLSMMVGNDISKLSALVESIISKVALIAKVDSYVDAKRDEIQASATVEELEAIEV